MLIKQYQLKRVEVSSKEWEEPKETQYFFETGIRRAIKIEPELEWLSGGASGEPKRGEDIWKYKVILVYNSWETKIEIFNILKSDIGDLYFGKDKYSDFVKSWVDGSFQKRTKEYFNNDLQEVLNKITCQ